MRKIHSIYYHDPKPELFERMIRRYKTKGFHFISISEFRDNFIGGNEISGRYCLITLDDGRKGNLNLLPIIEKYQVPICIFVAYEPILSGNFWWDYISKERGRTEMLKFKSLPYEEFNYQLALVKNKIHLDRSALTIEELKLLSQHPLVTIQSHTVNHPILTSVPYDVLEKELKQSKDKLREVCGYEMFAFSYPNGSLSFREVEAVRRYYQIAFTTEERHIKAGDNVLLLPRVALTGDYYRDILKIWGIWPYIKRVLGLIRKY